MNSSFPSFNDNELNDYSKGQKLIVWELLIKIAGLISMGRDKHIGASKITRTYFN